MVRISKYKVQTQKPEQTHILEALLPLQPFGSAGPDAHGNPLQITFYQESYCPPKGPLQMF